MVLRAGFLKLVAGAWNIQDSIKWERSANARIRLTPIAAVTATAATAQDSPSVRTQVGLISNDYIAILPGYAIPDSKRGTQRNGFTTSFIYGNQFTDHLSLEGQVQGSIFETGRDHGTDFYQWGERSILSYSLFDRRKP